MEEIQNMQLIQQEKEIIVEQKLFLEKKKNIGKKMYMIWLVMSTNGLWKGIALVMSVEVVIFGSFGSDGPASYRGRRVGNSDRDVRFPCCTLYKIILNFKERKIN